MTKTERDWISSAMVMIGNRELSEVQEIKVLRTIGQIFERSAVQAETKMIDQINQTMANDYFLSKIRQ